ncbi:MAG: type IV pilus modification PilV family protein [Armatimonadota bacterium]
MGVWAYGSSSCTPTLPHPHTPTLRRHRGLTLLEVIVAMALLAVGIAGALGAISACVRSSGAADDYSRGALFAQQVASELERSETLNPGTLDGTFDDATAGFTWTAEIGTADDQGLYPVMITVLWGEGRRHFELKTMLRPRKLPSAPSPAQPVPTQPGPQQPGPSQPGPPGEGGRG